MNITANVVPFSSVVGSSVTLHDDSGKVVCQLALLNTGTSGDAAEWKRRQTSFAEEIAARLNESQPSAALPGKDVGEDELELASMEAYNEGHEDGLAEAKSAGVDLWRSIARWLEERGLIEIDVDGGHSVSDFITALSEHEENLKRSALVSQPQPSAALPGKDVGAVPGVDSQVMTAAAQMTDAQKRQPEWLWFDDDMGGASFGRWQAVPTQAPYIRADLVSAALVSQPQPEGEAVDCCPICLVPFKPGDLCSTDIELGTCHAGCLEGSPTVNLETGEPTDGPIPTFHYAELVHPDPTLQGAGLIEALPPERHEAETRQIGDDAGPTSGAFDAGWNEYRRKALKILAARGVRP